MSACITVSIPSNEIDVLVGRECESHTFDIEVPVGAIDVLIEKPVLGERGTQGEQGPPGQDAAEHFESVSKNIKSNPYSLNYNSGVLTSIVYTLPDGTITKTLNYTDGKLISIVLSGDTPSGIQLTKTLNYTGNSLTGVAYS